MWLLSDCGDSREICLAMAGRRGRPQKESRVDVCLKGKMVVGQREAQDVDDGSGSKARSCSPGILVGDDVVERVGSGIGAMGDQQKGVCHRCGKAGHSAERCGVLVVGALRQGKPSMDQTGQQVVGVVIQRLGRDERKVRAQAIEGIVGGQERGGEVWLPVGTRKVGSNLHVLGEGVILTSQSFATLCDFREESLECQGWVFRGKRTYQAREGYDMLRGQREKVPWAKMVWSSEIFPQHQFILWFRGGARI
ncbi:hypothetical protein Dimus_024196 [Dionaea muscipula]